MTLTHGQSLIEILPLSDLYTVYKDHHRLRVFASKGRECVICERSGVLLLKTRGRDGMHVDLFTDDFVLMTVDHIVPKSIARRMGWTRVQIEDLSNKQPMCDPCNNKKGNEPISNEEYKERRLKNGCPQKIKGVEIIRGLVHNEGVFSKSLEGVACTST